MGKAFPTIIYWQEDQHDSECGAWLQISHFDAGVTVAIFREKPDEDSQVNAAMASVDVFPNNDDQGKVELWDEHTDPDTGNSRTVMLIESVSEFKPRPVSE